MEKLLSTIQDDVYFGDSKIDAKQLKPVARLAGNDYAKLGEQFTIERQVIDNLDINYGFNM